MSDPLTYAAVTPARNESANLRRLAESMASQRLAPLQWVIVDNGSTDDTAEAAAEIAARLPFVSIVTTPSKPADEIRGGPIVLAFEAGVETLAPVDIVVKLDADVSFEDDFFAELVRAFADDARLGIASGTCYEQDAAGVWQAQHTTRGHVRGATRAYRAGCLKTVLPLERRLGWDGIDELKAQVEGWQTRALVDVPFRHHRALGAREPSWSKWVRQGDMAHYMGYRPSYLLARSAYRSLSEPAATGMVWGYLVAAANRKKLYADTAVRNHLRDQQRFRVLPRRLLEASGRTPSRASEPARQ